MKPHAKVIGFGSYLPDRVLSNADLEKMIETSDAWIRTRTGIEERRLAAKDESSSDMGYRAAKCALEDADVSPEEVDCILFATLTPDYPFPSTACLIQGRLGAVRAASMDLQAACAGYLYALSIAQAFVESGIYRTILVVSAEKLSSIVDYEDRNTCVLFGDGAAACLVADRGAGFAVEKVVLGADGRWASLLILPAGGSREPATEETVRRKRHYLQMRGREVFKQAVRRMADSIEECLHRSGLKEEEIAWLVPHQANVRIIDALAKRFRVPDERVFVNVNKYGNTSGASIGIALDEFVREKELQRGERVVLSAFGSGLTFGAAALRWEGRDG